MELTETPVPAARPPVLRTVTNDELAAAIHRHSGFIHRVCRRMKERFPVADPDDLYGACLDRLAEVLPQIDPSRGNVPTYLLVCLYRAAHKAGRAAMRVRDHAAGGRDDDFESQGGDATGASDQIRNVVDPGPVRDTGWGILKPLLSRLPQQQRLIVQLRWFAGPDQARRQMDWRAISREMGIKVDAVQSLYEAAMRSLRLWAAESCIDPDGDC